MKLEATHSTLRQTAAVKLQSHVRRYLTIKRSGTTTPSAYSDYSIVSETQNGEVCGL